MSEPKPVSSTSVNPQIASEALSKALEEGAGQDIIEHSNTALDTFLDKYAKHLAIGLGAAAVIGAGLVYFSSHQKKKAEEQGAAFVSAADATDYEKVIQNFPNTPAAGSAAFMKAMLLAKDEAKLDEAISELGKFTSNFPKHPLAEQAAFRAAALTGQKAAEDGVKKLGDFMSQYPKSAFWPLAGIRKGDLLNQLGKTDEAKKAYEEVQKSTDHYGNPFIDGKGQLGNMVKERLEKAGMKAPELVEFVPEPAPPTPGAHNSGLPGLGQPGSPISITPGGPGTPGSPISITPGAPMEIKAPGLSLDTPAAAPEGAPTEIKIDAPTLEPAPAPAAEAPKPTTPAAEAPAKK